MIKLRHQQPSLWHRGLAEDIEGLWEPWMLLGGQAAGRRATSGHGVRSARGTPSSEPYSWPNANARRSIVAPAVVEAHPELELRRAGARSAGQSGVSRLYPDRGWEKLPDAKTLARLGQLIEPKVIAQLHRRVVELAQERGVTQGRKLRVDTTVVESNIHYPTDSSLLGDGTRVLTRTMKKIESKSGGLKRKVRDRMRSIRKRVLAIALSTRLLGPPGEKRRKRQYRELLSLTRKVINQAQRVLAEVKQSPRRRRTPVESLTQSLETMVGRVRQVVKQTRIRIFAGDTKSPGKIVSVFEPHTEIIRKGKASKPNEFGKLVKIQEAENQIVTHFEVYAERPADSTLLLSSIQVHRQRLGRIPRMVAADAGFYSRENEKAGQALGVRWLSVPNQKTTSSERKRLQHQRWFRSGQKWRTGSEGRISVLKRRHGLRRCLYPGLDGMCRWVGLGVIADNFIQMGCYLARPST